MLNFDFHSEGVDWRIVLGSWVAKVVSVTNSLVVFFVCRIIWNCSPNALVGIVLACSLTTVVIHFFCQLANLGGCLGFTLSRIFQRDIISWASNISFWILKYLGKVMHGYEVHGMDNLPKSTGALIIYPHHLIPYDILYVMSDYYVEHRKPLSSVVHRDLEAISFGLCKLIHFFSSKEMLKRKLKRGEICSVAPGGGFEAAFSENNELLWNGRTGFAAVAKECKVPIIPMFTVNGREAMPIRTPFFRGFFKEVYEKTRQVFFLPVVQFPVKMRIILGEPIFCGEDESAAEFARRTEMEIHRLRHKHQRQSGSTLIALLERFGYSPAMAEQNSGEES